MYLPLRWCGFAFKYFEKQLGDEQYHPSRAEAKPENRLLFCAIPCPSNSCNERAHTKRTFNTCFENKGYVCYCCNGNGCGYPSHKTCYSRGTTLYGEGVFPRNWVCKRDGKQSFATLYYNNRDIAKNRVGLSDDIRKFCCLEDNCLRGYPLKSLDAIDTKCIGHLCCSYCESVCDCDECLLKSCHVNCLP